MSGTRSDARKAREHALFGEPQWAPSEAESREDKALRAVRKVYGTAEQMDANALLDAFDDEGLLR